MAERRANEISWATLWRVFFFISIVAVMYIGRNILLGLFLAIVISSGLEFIVSFLEKRGLPRTLGVIIIFLSAAILVIMTLYTVLPGIVLDVVHLNEVFQKLNRIEGPVFSLPFLSTETIRTVSDYINRFSTNLLRGESPFGAVTNIVGGFALAVSIIVASFYLSLTRNGVERFLLAVMPADSEEAALAIYEKSIRRIGLWFRSQLILSIIIGALVYGTLAFLGVKYALVLSILTAIFELVPYMGPILSGSAAVVAAMTTSPELAFYTLLAFVGIHQIESHILVPLIVGRNVGLHPVIVIVSLLIGAEVAGFLGIIISVPAAVVLQEMVEHWSSRKKQRLAAV